VIDAFNIKFVTESENMKYIFGILEIPPEEDINKTASFSCFKNQSISNISFYPLDYKKESLELPTRSIIVNINNIKSE
jgi:hypothetical protein